MNTLHRLAVQLVRAETHAQDALVEADWGLVESWRQYREDVLSARYALLRGYPVDVLPLVPRTTREAA